jgi:hypothetical protein
MALGGGSTIASVPETKAQQRKTFPSATTGELRATIPGMGVDQASCSGGLRRVPTGTSFTSKRVEMVFRS